MRGNKPPVSYCSTGKVRFDKKGAQTSKNFRMKREHTKLRIYNCPECNGWHLSSLNENSKKDRSWQ